MAKEVNWSGFRFQTAFGVFVTTKSGDGDGRFSTVIVIDPNKPTVRISMRLQLELDNIVEKVNAGKGLVVVVV